jgi:hypothetical protein
MAVLYDYYSRNIPITKPFNGYEPPDTDELNKIVNGIKHYADRIWVLRLCLLRQYGLETGRLVRERLNRKKAIQKAYERGFRNGWKKRKGRYV